MAQEHLRSIGDNMLLMLIIEYFCCIYPGADLFLNKRIEVTFVPMASEFLRMPKAHTCGCVLELARVFDSYASFSMEMNGVLKPDVWVMDCV